MRDLIIVLSKLFVGREEDHTYNIPLFIAIILVLWIALMIAVYISKKNSLYVSKKRKLSHRFRKKEAV